MFRRESPEVAHAWGPLAVVDELALQELRRHAAASSKRRSRYCLHRCSQDGLHEMVIALHRDSYVRPHRHVHKSESFHMIEGRLDIIFYSEFGQREETLSLGEPGSGLPFLYRLNEPLFHTVVARTEWVLFHETTNGPWRPQDTEWAAWAPVDGSTAAEDFLRQL